MVHRKEESAEYIKKNIDMIKEIGEHLSAAIKHDPKQMEKIKDWVESILMEENWGIMLFSVLMVI